MNDIAWQSSAEFWLTIDDIPISPPNLMPLSSAEFWIEFQNSSDWEVLDILPPDETICPYCKGPVTSDSLGGFDCERCGEDVI